jgi:hypothetical protein
MFLDPLLLRAFPTTSNPRCLSGPTEDKQTRDEISGSKVTTAAGIVEHAHCGLQNDTLNGGPFENLDLAVNTRRQWLKQQGQGLPRPV